MPIHDEYRRRLITETDRSGTPTSTRLDGRMLRTAPSTTRPPRDGSAAGRPAPGSRPGEGDVIARFASGEPILRYSPAPPMIGTTGEIEPLSLWAGQSVALAKQPEPAAEIVAELASGLSHE